MRKWTTTSLSAVVAIACLAGFAHTATAATFTTQQVNTAIERAKKLILGQQQADGTFTRSRSRRVGNASLALIALHDCGVSVRNPAWRKGAAWLIEQEVKGTYEAALRLIAISIGARVEDRYLKFVQAEVRRFVKGMRPNGGWRYLVDHKLYGGSVDSDNSASQYVALALREAAYARAEVPKKVWEMLEKYWRTKQCKDGGWDYGNQSASGAVTPGGTSGYGSMSAAGLASSYIVFDMILSRMRGSRPTCRTKTYKPIERGLRWFDKNFRADVNPRRATRRYYYYLYNIERIGATSGRKYFGKHDWYAEVAAILLARQRENGYLGRVFYEHCWATIFLAKANAPVVMNKLEYHDLDWDVHSRDVANLVRYMSDDPKRGFERPLNWQIVDMKRDVRELHDAPVLFLTGRKAVKFDAEDVAKFRRFVLEGGTLLAQAACGSRTFQTSFRALCRRALPEYEMSPLQADHPVFGAHSKIRGVKMFGIDNGVRTCVFLLPEDLSFYWHRRMAETHTRAFQLGVNVVIYAMDRAGFRTKTVIQTLPAVEATRKISAALIRHPAGWNANPTVLERLSDALAQKTKIGLDLKAPVELGKADLTGVRLLWLSGTHALQLPEAQTQALGDFINAGGTLFVDAANGSGEFYDSAIEMLNRLLPAATRKAAGKLDTIINGRFGDPAGYDCSEVNYRRVLRVEKRRDKSPELLLYSLGSRVAVIASPHDVSSGIQGQTPWACRGYEIDSARRLGVNVVLQADEAKRSLD